MTRRTVKDVVEFHKDSIHKVKLAETGAELRAVRRENDRLIAELSAAQTALGIRDALAAAKAAKPIKATERTGKFREGCPFVMLSDWHVEERVEPDGVNGLNEYNPAIVRKRVKKLCEAITQELVLERHMFKMRHAILWMGGDFISGYIHPELEESNYMSPTHAILFAQEQLSHVLNTMLASEFDTITVMCNYGNHGRTLLKRRVATSAQNSFEWLMYKSLEQRYSGDKRVRFSIANGAHLYQDVFGSIIHTHHGDDIKYYGGVGGITIPVNKATAQWDKAVHADENVYGHYHQRMSYRRVSLNGSLIGYNEFAMSIKAEPEPPMQGMFIWDSKRGKCHAKELWVAESGHGLYR